MVSICADDRVDGGERLDRVFRALGDRTRRRLLHRLARGPAMVSELARPFEMSLPAIGKHIRVLERAGLIRREVDGRIHRCSLSPQPLRDADEWLDQYRKVWDRTLENLGRRFHDDTRAR